MIVNKRVRKFGFTFLKYLLISIVAIITFYIAKEHYNDWKFKDAEPSRYAEGYDGIINESEYIISEQMILSKLQMKSEIVSFEQDIFKKETYVDKKIMGERKTEIEIKGKYKMGLSTKDIKVNYIDSSARVVFIELPKPTLISLEIDYDDIKFDKKQGFFRLAMNDEEKEKFYKSVKNGIIHELNNDEEIIEKANLYNQQAIKEIIVSMTDIKNVVFN